MTETTTITAADLHRLLEINYSRRQLYPRNMRNLHCRVLIRQIRAMIKYEREQAIRARIHQLRQLNSTT